MRRRLGADIPGLGCIGRRWRPDSGRQGQYQHAANIVTRIVRIRVSNASSAVLWSVGTVVLVHRCIARRRVIVAITSTHRSEYG